MWQADQLHAVTRKGCWRWWACKIRRLYAAESKHLSCRDTIYFNSYPRVNFKSNHWDAL